MELLRQRDRKCVFYFSQLPESASDFGTQAALFQAPAYLDWDDVKRKCTRF